MTFTARQLNRATLDRQMLLRREPVDVPTAVDRVVAIQAQEPASPYIALWNRIEGFDPADLDEAFVSGVVRKASLMRITLHAVTSADHEAFHHAMLPALRASRLYDKRFKSMNVTIDQADALLEHLLEFAATPRQKAEIEELLHAHVGDVGEPGVWWALRTYGGLVHAPTGGPWSFGLRPSYQAVTTEPREQLAAVAEMLRRYLTGFGPATVLDMNQFSMLPRTAIREALASLDLVRDGDHYDVPDRTIPDEDTPAPPRLMAMWDSTLLAYADRSRIIPDEYRKLVIRDNGDTLPTLLVDGHVAGVWRPTEDGGVEATAFHALDEEQWAGLADEAASLRKLLGDREPQVYKRYARWWNGLPAHDVRIV
ncbi:winged helix DNA-binding domain-containing protein [Lentzea sp. BCCO 10_0798]|uniref:Winged helix DNA-binding domain-containing protein n=1 Tax=Lentzea kristufekii TaxID=3095430 RepID=A0ABU4U5J4_9PSEU|nr:winged helix DNA-binding domain-containing protein [Lentzea sp. BCCO 10_0798]MDX8055839.1 winged helix DNA-binding domain-containing protein [Lentzea sp. BCCO 10_0798]